MLWGIGAGVAGIGLYGSVFIMPYVVIFFDSNFFLQWFIAWLIATGIVLGTILWDMRR